MTTLYEGAFAKVNLTLDVLGKREDGYHDLQSVMQTISIRDDVEIDVGTGKPWTLECSREELPQGEENLAWKAAKIFCDTMKIDPDGLAIRITKRIPSGAGMGGGSADAAAVLRGLNRAFDNRLSAERLEELAAEVGSDVAFCVRGGTMLAHGRGELLSELPDMPKCIFVICKPQFSISTPELFRKLDQVSLRRHPDTAGLISALEQGNLRELCCRMYNVFEDVNDRRMRTVAAIKSVLIDKGALGAVMTGTGSAVFGVFSDKTEAEGAREELKREHGFCCLAECVGRLI